MTFRLVDSAESHSLKILNQFYEYDDFMAGIQNLIDLGCGNGQDLEWWASRHTREEIPRPLNIRCVGVDITNNLQISKKYPNIVFQQLNFENEFAPVKHGYNMLWCHNAFQYSLNPLNTLRNWWKLAAPDATLVISVPQTVVIKERKQAFYLHSGCYYQHTMVSLMYMLATTGWDCKNGFFQQQSNDSWITAVVYKSEQQPQDPRTTSWYDLVEAKLLPDSADKSIMAHGYLQQQDLILRWIDKSFFSMKQL